MPRVKEYDKQEVLARAMWVFWEKGFLGTSIQDLVGGMGINRFSIYDSFQSKEELYVLALQKYRMQILGSQLAILNESTGGLESIHVYFSALIQLYTSGKVPAKCLMASAISEFRPEGHKVTEMVNEYISELNRGFRAALDRASDLDELPSWINIPSSSYLLVSLSLGLVTLAGSLSQPTLSALVEQAVESLRTNN